MSLPLLFDDAAIFPPGNLGLAEAVVAHRRHRRAPYAALVGPLVVDLPRLEELQRLTHLLGEEPLDLCLVVPDAAGAVTAVEAMEAVGGWRSEAAAGLRLVAIEVRVAEVAGLRAALAEVAALSGVAEVGAEGSGLTVVVELPRGPRSAAVIVDLAGTTYRAKIRTGGTEAAAYPDEAELADTLRALAEAGVRFKATAGLHHALRHTDPVTGFEEHGFLNLLAATDAAARGADGAEIAAVLAHRDATALLTLPARTGLPTTSALESIGTCSIDQPVADLRRMGLIP
ncbi:hypothetical protein [Nocardioides sp.]|uniref:hypothetical protein n=1 Tax=Nocardioides sp. TaxID=35761 RepID=UPI0026306410|nr:hypothetical protein [Nocardioides sp.]